jgi:hypothetical protein
MNRLNLEGVYNPYAELMKGFNSIDAATLQRIRSPKSVCSGGIYVNDYEDISALKEIAASRNVSILLVHHLRKQKDSDVFNQVSGSSGITGAVDTSYVLQKESRESKTATLIATGRDIEMQKMMYTTRLINAINSEIRA